PGPYRPGLEKSEPSSLDDIVVFGPGRANKLSVVIGYPAEVAVPKQWGPSATLMPAKSVCYGTVPFMESELPKVPDYEPPADSAIDTSLSSPVSDTTKAETNEPISLPHPGGMSGGGMWDLGFEPGTVWSPSSAKLFAIQASWNSQQRYLRGVQIVHWLRLIC